MKLLKIIATVCIPLVIGAGSASAQTVSTKSSENIAIEIPCINEFVTGTLYTHNISHVTVNGGFNKWFSNIHSSELECSTSGNKYRLAGSTEEIISSSETGSIYYAVWHYVGSKGVQFKIVITYGDISDLGETGINIISVESSCE